MPSFRIAFAVSLSLHLFAISAAGFFPSRPAEDARREIEVTYLLPPEPKSNLEEKILRNFPLKYELEKKKPQQSPQEAKIAKEPAPQKSDSPIKEERLLKEEDLENLEEYIQYYELIREKIKARAAGYRRVARAEGRVNLRFALSKNGSVKDLAIDEPGSAKNHRLREAAVKSVRGASPFPPFPKSLKTENLNFAISIIFRKK